MGAGLYSARVELMQTTGHHGRELSVQTTGHHSSESEEARMNLTNTMQSERSQVQKRAGCGSLFIEHSGTGQANGWCDRLRGVLPQRSNAETALGSSHRSHRGNLCCQGTMAEEGS